MTEPLACSVRLVHPVLVYLRKLGVSIQPLLAQTGLEVRQILDPMERISHDLLLTIWEEAGRLTQDADLGIHAAESLDYESLGSIEAETPFLAVAIYACSATVGEGLDAFVRTYQPFAHLTAHYSILREDAGLSVAYHIDGDLARTRSVVEFSLALPTMLLRTLACEPIEPSAVKLRQPTSGSSEEKQRAFGAPIHFAREEDALILPTSCLQVPLRTVNLPLRTRLIERADAICKQLVAAQRLKNRVRAQLERAPASELPTAERTARALGLSLRTLTRRLEAEGVSFQSIVDEVRGVLALKLLREPRSSVSEVALRLGFSDPSSFRRAFQRWHGTSLAEFRKSLS